MIRRLQKKFIIIAVLSVFIVLLILIGTINIINYRNMVTEVDSTLEILAAYKGYFPMQFRNMFRTDPQGWEGTGSLGHRSMTAELPSQTRSFTAFSAQAKSCPRRTRSKVPSRQDSIPYSIRAHPSEAM